MVGSSHFFSELVYQEYSNGQDRRLLNMSTLNLLLKIQRDQGERQNQNSNMDDLSERTKRTEAKLLLDRCLPISVFLIANVMKDKRSK